jgi:hypothetical protein
MSSTEPGRPPGREPGNRLQRFLRAITNPGRGRGPAGRGGGAQHEAGPQRSDAPPGVGRPSDHRDHQPATLASAARGLRDGVQRWWRAATRRGHPDRDAPRSGLTQAGHDRDNDHAAPRTSQEARSSFSSGTDFSRASVYDEWGQYLGHYRALVYDAPSQADNHDESRTYGDDPRVEEVRRRLEAGQAYPETSLRRDGLDFER